MSIAPPFEISPQDLKNEIEAYREARAARLSSKQGWLSLINKVWLDDGVYRIGSEEGADVLLPRDRAPRQLATVTRQGSRVELAAAPGVVLKSRGEPITSLILRSDATNEPDVVTFGSLSFQLLERSSLGESAGASDFALRVRDGESPLLRAFRGVDTFPIDPSWRIVARLERYTSEREVIYEDGDGRPQRYFAPGHALFERGGSTYRLEPVYESDRKRLFVLFTDETNRDQTYGAGRFLYTPVPMSDFVVLDFNKAFNPPCAFTPYAVCPLPSPENRLALRVEAGEKRP